MKEGTLPVHIVDQSLDKASRRALNQGALKFRKRYFFLFDDMLIEVRELKSGNYKFEHSYNLPYVELKEKLEGDQMSHVVSPHDAENSSNHNSGGGSPGTSPPQNNNSASSPLFSFLMQEKSNLNQQQQQQHHQFGATANGNSVIASSPMYVPKISVTADSEYPLPGRSGIVRVHNPFFLSLNTLALFIAMLITYHMSLITYEISFRHR